MADHSNQMNLNQQVLQVLKADQLKKNLWVRCDHTTTSTTHASTTVVQNTTVVKPEKNTSLPEMKIQCCVFVSTLCFCTLREQRGNHAESSYMLRSCTLGMLY